MNHNIPVFTLHDGLVLPAIGLGTYGLRGAKGVNAISYAIQSGYRLIDTAYNYENEATVGEAVRRSHIRREELLITSKLPGRYHSYDDAMITIQESLYRASLDYYDLYLIHWPNPIQNQYVEAWQALIDAQKWGLIRSIGVCNFLPEHLARLEQETGVLPVMNQIELHPYFNQQVQLDWHQEHQIQTQSWSPLGRGNTAKAESIIKTIADRHQKTVAQIILRWQYECGSISIPKSASSTRQQENISIFDFQLHTDEIESINSLTRQNGRNKDQDPAVYEEF